MQVVNNTRTNTNAVNPDPRIIITNNLQYPRRNTATNRRLLTTQDNRLGNVIAVKGDIGRYDLAPQIKVVQVSKWTPTPRIAHS